MGWEVPTGTLNPKPQTPDPRLQNPDPRPRRVSRQVRRSKILKKENSRASNIRGMRTQGLPTAAITPFYRTSTQKTGLRPVTQKKSRGSFGFYIESSVMQPRDTVVKPRNIAARKKICRQKTLVGKRFDHWPKI